jgi:UDP-glucose-4-epimerase GalE
MILVTGGAGYIGSHYVLYERARGAEVLVLDDLSLGHREAVLDAPFLCADLSSPDVLDAVFRSYPIEAVVHFAALASVPESVTYPERYYRHNVAHTVALLEAMLRHDVRFLVFSSSCATYGNPVYSPMDEAHPQNPINPYGESKRICEKMMAAFDSAHGLKYVSLRYFNASGADPQARIGESHDPETHLIPIALQVARGKRASIAIYGDDYPTPDGTCVRDYIHVNDLAQAHALALDHLRSGKSSDVFNLGSGTGHSVQEVVEACRQVTGHPIPTVKAARRPGDPPVLVAVSTKAERELGWRPTFTDLSDIVATAWNWEQHRRY